MMGILTQSYNYFSPTFFPAAPLYLFLIGGDVRRGLYFLRAPGAIYNICSQENFYIFNISSLIKNSSSVREGSGDNKANALKK
jgi:hypothetical protein